MANKLSGEKKKKKIIKELSPRVQIEKKMCKMWKKGKLAENDESNAFAQP